ncbi:MAG TPA: AIM24 family protein, partial [Saprospiraceae bacterium]|nr:AIM24 family protein [Saprospiraceae bacterium]
MNFQIKYQPSYALLVAYLEQGETLTAEAGSMTYMTPNMEVHTRKREKSLWGTLGLSLIGGQSFWVNDYFAANGSAEAGFAAAPVGDIKQLDIAPGSGYVIQ